MGTIPYHEGAAVIVQNADFETIKILSMNSEFYSKYAENCYWVYSKKGASFGIQECFINE